MGRRWDRTIFGAVGVLGMVACGAGSSSSSAGGPGTAAATRLGSLSASAGRVSSSPVPVGTVTTPSPTWSGSSEWTWQVFTAASDTVAYLLATDRSASSRLYVTTDAGVSFHDVSASAGVTTTAGQSDPAQLVFPTPTSGYALSGSPWIGSSVLTVTADGGATWRRVSLPSSAGSVAAVAGHGSRVYAATVRCSSPSHCTGVQIWSAVSGSGDFTRIRASLPDREAADGVGLAAWQDSLWVMLGVGSTTNPVTVRSSDAGASFTTRPGPSAVRCDAAPTSSQVAWTSCSTGMLMAFQRVLGDGPPAVLPVAGAGTGGTVLMAVSDDVAFFGSSFGQWAGLYETTDGGQHFTWVSDGPPGYTGTGTPYAFSFLSTRIGFAAAYGAGLYRTIDGGRSWQPVPAP
jgi:hypothetical protein